MWDDPKTMNAVSFTLVLFASICIALGIATWIARQPYFVFKDVEIENVHRADPARLMNVTRNALKGTFFTVNLNRVLAALKTEPWVKSADLYRRWPDRLEISIVERTPFASWNQTQLIDADGTVFDAPYDGDLPDLSGDDRDSQLVLNKYIQWKKLLLTRGLELDSLARSARGDWKLGVNGNAGSQTIELGRDDAGERLARFVQVYPDTVAAAENAGLKVSAIDLRYPNGIAVRIKENETEKGKR